MQILIIFVDDVLVLLFYCYCFIYYYFLRVIVCDLDIVRTEFLHLFQEKEPNLMLRNNLTN